MIIEYKSRFLPTEFSKLNNGLFKAIKSHTGSGGTTAMLKSDIPTIILTPNVSHIKSKENDRANLEGGNIKILFLYHNSKDELRDRKELIEQGYTVHIYTTYATFVLYTPSVIARYSDIYRLVADEYHVLTTNEYLDITERFFNVAPEFKTVVLTTATKPEIDLFPTFKKRTFINTNKAAQVFRCKEFSKKKHLLNQVIAETLNTDNHVLLITNDNDYHSKTFIENDNVVGNGLEKKVAIYNHQDNYKEIDYSKRIHVLSSSAWEGMDFNEKCKIIHIGEYTHSSYSQHKILTKIDITQATGRGRNEIEDVLFFYTMSKGYLSKLKAIDNGTNFYKKETQKGVIALFSANFNRETKSLKRVKYTAKAEIPKDLIKQLSQRDILTNIAKFYLKDDVINNPFDHLSIDRIIKQNRDLSSSKGKQYGLNSTELSYFLAYKILNDSNAIDYVSSKKYSTHSKSLRALINTVVDGIALAHQNINFLDSIVKNMPSAPKQPKTIHKKIAKHIESLYLETDRFIDGGFNISPFNMANQDESTKFERDACLVAPYVNIIALSRIGKRSKELDKAIDLKAKEKGADRTVSQYRQQHKQFLLERLMAYNNKHQMIELKVKNRKYSTLTGHPKELRKFTTLHSVERDIVAAFPTIIANKGWSKALDINTVYDSASKSRDEMKVIVNTLLNQHTQDGYNIEHWILGLEKYLKMTEAEAIHFTENFNLKGAFSDYATEIEADIIESLRIKEGVIGSKSYRLHDALIMFGMPINKELNGIDREKDEYPTKLKAA